MNERNYALFVNFCEYLEKSIINVRAGEVFPSS